MSAPLTLAGDDLQAPSPGGHGQPQLQTEASAGPAGTAGASWSSKAGASASSAETPLPRKSDTFAGHRECTLHKALNLAARPLVWMRSREIRTFVPRAWTIWTGWKEVLLSRCCRESACRRANDRTISVPASLAIPRVGVGVRFMRMLHFIRSGRLAGTTANPGAREDPCDALVRRIRRRPLRRRRLAS
jgi:hypothetical protein